MAFDGVISAIRVNVFPISSTASVLSKVIFFIAIISGFTVTSQEDCKLSFILAVIVVLPSLLAVIVPFLSTVATEELLLNQLHTASNSFGNTSAFNVFLSPTVICKDFLSSVISQTSSNSQINPLHDLLEYSASFHKPSSQSCK